MSRKKDLIFADIKNKINIDELVKNSGIIEPVILVEYIINMPCSKKKTNAVVLGSAYIPQIVLLGDSGRLYYFSLYAVLGDLSSTALNK